MAVFRGDLPSRTVLRIIGAAVKDARLTHKARGILLSITQQTPGTEIRVQDLSKASADGPDAVLSGLQELTLCGYLTSARRVRSLGRGRAPMDYHLVTETRERVA